MPTGWADDTDSYSWKETTWFNDKKKKILFKFLYVLVISNIKLFEEIWDNVLVERNMFECLFSE